MALETNMLLDDMKIGDHFDDILREKENELRQIQSRKLQALTEKLKEREDAFSILTSKFQTLQRDFEYNLQVIDQRDNDVHDLTDNILSLRKVIDNKEEDVKEQKQLMAEMKKAYDAQLASANDKIKGLIERLDDFKAETRLYRTGQIDEVKKTRVEYEEKLREVREKTASRELELQKIQDDLSKRLKEEIDARRLESGNSEQLIKQLSKEKKDLCEKIASLNEKLANEKGRLLDDLNSKKHEIVQKENKYVQEFREMKEQLEETIRDRDELRRELEKEKLLNGEQGKGLKAQLEALSKEVIKLKEKLAAKKAKHGKEIEDLTRAKDQEVSDLRKLNEDLKGRYERTIKELETQVNTLIYSEKKLQETIRELQFQYGKEQQLTQDKQSFLTRNIEQESKKMKNEMDLKDMQVRHLNEEKTELAKEVTELRARIKEKEDKVIELDSENKILIQEVIQYRKEAGGEIRPGALLAKNGEVKEKAGHFHLLQVPVPQGSDQKKLREMEKVDEEESFEKLFSEDLGPVSPLISVADSKKLELLKFGGGHSRPPQGQRETPMGKSNAGMRVSMEKYQLMSQRVADLDNQIREYKILIDEMRREMENAKMKVQIANQETNMVREESVFLRTKNTSLQEEMVALKEKAMKTQMEKTDIEMKMRQWEAMRTMNENTKEIAEQENKKMKKDLETIEKEAGEMREKIHMLKNDNAKLKQERDQLIAISNELRSQIGKLEDGLQDVAIHTDDEVQRRNNGKIAALENVIHDLEKQIGSLQDEVYEKTMYIEKMKTMIPYKDLTKGTAPSQPRKVSPPSRTLTAVDKRAAVTGGKYNDRPLPNYSNFHEIGSMRAEREDKAKQMIESPQKNELFIISKNKPLAERQKDEPEERVRPATGKADGRGLRSSVPGGGVKKEASNQRPVEQPKRPIARNFNVKDDDEFMKTLHD